MQKIKLITLLLFVTILHFSSSAQSFRGGFTAGFSGCQIEGDDYGGYHKLGCTLGFFVNNSFTSSKGFQFELHYTLKGSKSPDEWLNIGLHYAEIPVMFTYNLSKIAKKESVQRIYFDIGLAPAILIGVTNKGRIMNYTFSKIDLASLLGIGYKITDKFSLSARHTWTIIGISPLNIGMHNNCITFSMFYYIK